MNLLILVSKNRVKINCYVYCLKEFDVLKSENLLYGLSRSGEDGLLQFLLSSQNGVIAEFTTSYYLTQSCGADVLDNPHLTARD